MVRDDIVLFGSFEVALFHVDLTEVTRHWSAPEPEPSVLGGVSNELSKGKVFSTLERLCTGSA